MSKREELIKSLRASAATMPFDAAVAVQYRAAADALEAQAREIEGLRKQDEALILQLVEALERSSPHTDHEYRFKPEDWMKRRAEAIQAGRARLEGKP